MGLPRNDEDPEPYKFFNKKTRVEKIIDGI